MAELERNAAVFPDTQSNTANADTEGLPVLFGRLGDDVVKLLDTKLSLLKVELQEDAAVYARGAAMIGVGASVALVGLSLALVAIAFFVSYLLPTSVDNPSLRYALGFLITGALFLIVGGILVVVFKNRLTARNPVPNRSVDEIRKDKQWLKNEM